MDSFPAAPPYLPDHPSAASPPPFALALDELRAELVRYSGLVAEVLELDLAHRATRMREEV